MIALHQGGCAVGDTKPAMKMPELLVFAKLFVVGFVGAETLTCPLPAVPA